MKKPIWMLIALAGAAGLVALAGAAANPPSHNDIAGKPALVAADADADLKRTVVVADYEHALEPGKTVVWCSTLQLAWNELAGTMGAPIKMSAADAPPRQAAAIAALNASAVTRDDLDAPSYLAMAGFGRDDILSKIRAALTEKFKGAASPSLIPNQIDSDDIFAYSYLFKNLAFADPFIRRDYALEFGTTSVASFGLWDTDRVTNWAKLASQVSILSYASPEDWVVELKTTSPGDRLLIARLPAQGALGRTVDAALGRAADQPQKMDRRDILLVPIMNFDLTRRYRELAGAEIAGTRVAGRIRDAVQNIRLRLDERGAVLKSEAAIAVATSAVVSDKPRSMICDGPFLMIMMREGSPRPYFAMWVDNPELLVPFAKR